MSGFVLWFIIYTHDGPTMHTAQYSSNTACQAAGRKIVAKFGKDKKSRVFWSDFECTEVFDVQP